MLKALDKLGHLESYIKGLLYRLEADIVRPLLEPSSPCRSTVDRSETAITIDLTPAESASIPADTFHDLEALLQVIDTDVFPPDSFTKRDQQSADLKRFILQTTLDSLLLPDMPSDLDALPIWLDSVKEAAAFEARILQSTMTQPLIAPFYEKEAGGAWAVQRRRFTEEKVRSIILKGWDGWQSDQVSRQKEVSIMVEVEVNDDLPSTAETLPETTASRANGMADKQDESFGWGFEEDPKPPEPTEMAANQPTTRAEEEGWGFDDSAKSEAVAASNAEKAEDHTMQEDDGWAFDEPVVPVVQPTPKPAKPAREAKRLGKKVAKARVRDEDEPMTSEAESSVAGSATGRELSARSNGHKKLEDDWGAWEDPPAESSRPSAQIEATRRKRKELREEKTTIEETFLVSKACDALLSLAEGILLELQKLSTMS